MSLKPDCRNIFTSTIDQWFKGIDKRKGFTQQGPKIREGSKKI